ncbi:MAG: DUF3887 domain-containing protein [Lachnospiraceae bacterium]|nr:DUF3887 domain-containing protein [Lachnospiraceae bacterium]
MTAEKYVRQIVKRLKCSGKRKEEIRRQLLADVRAELESGEALEDIVRRMGDPSEIAGEFNQNMPETERKRYARKKRMKLCFIVIDVILLLALTAYWFFPKAKELADSGSFRTEEVEGRAKQVVLSLDADDYETLQKSAAAEMIPFLNAESMDRARDQVAKDRGEFRQFGNFYMAEVEQQGRTFAVVELTAAYEKTNITYTISFDEDMRLAGLYMK